MKELKQTILETLSEKNITMIPKWKLVAYSLGAIIFVSFLLLTLIFIFSLIFFILSLHGFLFLPFFGAMMTFHMLKALPLFLLFIAIVLIIIIEFFSRHYTTTFKRPVLITIIGITIFSLVIGFVVSLTPMHKYAHNYMKRHHMAMRHMYDRPVPFKSPGQKTVLRGQVVSVSSTSMIISLPNNEEVTIRVPQFLRSTGTEQRMPAPRVGDDIVVMGVMKDGFFEMIDGRLPSHNAFPKKDFNMMKIKETRDDEIKP